MICATLGFSSKSSTSLSGFSATFPLSLRAASKFFFSEITFCTHFSELPIISFFIASTSSRVKTFLAS
jgi:hypothetical protein